MLSGSFAFGFCDSSITCKSLNNTELLSDTGPIIMEFKANKSVNGVLMLVHTAETETALCLTLHEYQRTTSLWKANRSILDRFTLCQLHPPALSLSPLLNTHQPTHTSGASEVSPCCLSQPGTIAIPYTVLLRRTPIRGYPAALITYFFKAYWQ